MREIKVLMVGPDPKSQGGMATVIGNILNSKDLAQTVKITAWPSYIDGPIPKRAFFSIKREIDFRKIRQAYDIYHIHTASGTSFWRKRRYICSLGKASQRVVLHVHGGGFVDFWDRCSSNQREKIRTTFNSVGKVLALSEEWAHIYSARGICDMDSIEILPNAVDIPECNKTDYESNNVLFMGRLNENKSPDVLVRAAAIVNSLYPDAKFTFAGDGDPSPYETLANDLGIADACVFPGWVMGRSRESLFNTNAIYCLPSKREALPMGLLEAMSRGLAVVATRQGGIPSVVENGSSGRLFEVGNYDELAEILCDLMGSVAMKRSLGKAGRARIQKSFGMQAYVEKLAYIYEKLAS